MTFFPGHPAPYPERRDGDDISIAKLVAVLLDHKWIILSTAVVFLFGGYFYASSQPRVYQADALIQIESRSSTLGMLETLAVGDQARTPTSAELEILQSRMVLGQTVDRLDLAIEIEPRRLPGVGSFLVQHGVTSKWFERFVPSALFGWWPLGEQAEEGSPYVWAGESLRVSRFEVPAGREGLYHELRVTGEHEYELLLEGQVVLVGRDGETSRDAEGAGYRLFVSELQAHPGAEFRVRRVSRLAAIGKLTERLMIMPRGVDSGVFRLTLSGTDQEQIQQTLDTLTGVFLAQNVQRQSEEADKQIAFLNEQLPQVREQLADAETQLNEYRAQRDSVDLTFETQNLLNQLVVVENQLTELSLAEADLAQRFRPTHPNYQSLLRQRGQLVAEKERLEAEIENLPETQQEVLRLTRDSQVNQQVYVQLLNQYQEMRLVKAGTVGNVRILDSAVLGERAIAPRIPLTTLVAALLGALLAVVGVILKMVLSRAVESPGQLEEIGLPVYATVPESSEQLRMTRRIRFRYAKKGQNVFRGLLAERDSGEIAIEALRALRTSLYFAMLEAGNNRLMIAGPSPEVGKSFVAANLAAVCSQAGQKVLLIDADMRRGHLHHAFRQHSDNGLSNLLAGRVPMEKAIRHTDVEGLDFLPRGTIPPNPSELLMQQGFHDLLEAMSERYDLVVIDTPPVLAVTDAAVVGKLAGTSLMVVRFGRNAIKEVFAAKRSLEHSGVRLKGAILNGIAGSAATGHGYYGTYLYAYR